MTRHPSAPTSLHRRPGSGRRSRRFVAAVAVLAVALAALMATTGVAGARDGGQAATPTKGGTLKLLGTSDIFNLDTVSAYYTVSNLLERAFTRQLVSYPNAPTLPRLDQDRAGHRDGRSRRRGTASAPTARPTRSSCAPGVMWNTTRRRAR